ncbi:hypothetical protein HQ524_01320 [Candidatus Uhrbacteria bacterium]|nr:hypothetical protein [Candidatus Uhrbacteria bacterium]
MILVTGIEDSGVRIGVVGDRQTSFSKVPFFDIASEHYLLHIEKSVRDAGGWAKIDGWLTLVTGESYTSVRGLMALVNALSSLHSLKVEVLDIDSGDILEGVIPLSPSYSSEPNISKRK